MTLFVRVCGWWIGGAVVSVAERREEEEAAAVGGCGELTELGLQALGLLRLLRE